MSGLISSYFGILRRQDTYFQINNRQAGSMNPRVAGFPGAVTAILRMLHPAR